MAGPGLTDLDIELLINAATEARLRAYAPYSTFRVGAALLCEGGTIASGCNIENAAYPLGACAEAGAIAQMIMDGRKVIRAVAVVGGKTDSQPDSDPWSLCSPCGGCRQRLAEFAEGASTPVLIAAPETLMLQTTIGALLPHAFNLKD